MIENRRKRLGDILVEAGIITNEQLMQALRIQSETDLLLGRILIEHKFVTEDKIIEILEYQLGIPHLKLDKCFVDPAIPLLIPEVLAKKYELIPIQKEGNKLIVAMTDPMNIFAIDDLQTATGLVIQPAIAARADVLNAIALYYGKQKAEQAIEDFNKEIELSQIAEEAEEAEETLQNAPIVRLVNTIISQAVRTNASDIHVEPFEDEVVFRLRIDGNLQKVLASSKTTHNAIVARIKIMARLDIAEKRQPQDGRFETAIENKRVDMRVSVLPTIHGEKIVMRLLYRSAGLISKSNIGFTENNLKLFDKIIKSPLGMVLVTGPTGSGKSTTLYAILAELNTSEKNIVAVEDPVEYVINGISQVQVNEKAGVTFANSLRTFLRQDPDIIMVGEMRDNETCEIAVRAAITGHLVLSTLHTNDTAATITRLIDMGVEPFLVSTSLSGIIAQRLVRKICIACKQEIPPPVEELMVLGMTEEEAAAAKCCKGVGCPLCRGTGYKGRTAVHEVMPITKEIRALIAKGANADDIRDAAVRGGMSPLKQNCLELISNGITTVDEAIKIAYNIE